MAKKESTVYQEEPKRGWYVSFDRCCNNIQFQCLSYGRFVDHGLSCKNAIDLGLALIKQGHKGQDVIKKILKKQAKQAAKRAQV